MSTDTQETLAQFVDRRSREILMQSLNREAMQKILNQAGLGDAMELSMITDEQLNEFFATPKGVGLLAQGLSNCRLEALIEYLDKLGLERTRE